MAKPTLNLAAQLALRELMLADAKVAAMRAARAGFRDSEPLKPTQQRYQQSPAGRASQARARATARKKNKPWAVRSARTKNQGRPAQ